MDGEKQVPSRGFLRLVVGFFAFLLILDLFGRGIFFCEEYLEEAYVVFLSVPIGVYFFREVRAALTHRLSNEDQHHHGSFGSSDPARSGTQATTSRGSSRLPEEEEMIAEDRPAESVGKDSESKGAAWESSQEEEAKETSDEEDEDDGLFSRRLRFVLTSADRRFSSPVSPYRANPPRSTFGGAADLSPQDSLK